MARPAKPMCPTPTPEEKLADGSLSLAGAVEFSGVCETMLRRAIRAEELETFIVGKRHRLIVKRSLVAWLAKHDVKSNPG